jgi:hypothetical protein
VRFDRLLVLPDRMARTILTGVHRGPRHARRMLDRVPFARRLPMTRSRFTLAVAAMLAAVAIPARAEEPAIAAPRIALGAGVGVCGTVPDVGFVVAVPLAGRLAVDVTLAWQPRVALTPESLLVMAAARIPFRSGSRYALVAGAGRLEPRHVRSGDSGLFPTKGRLVHPVVGASLQWPRGRFVDLRIDAEAFLVTNSEIPVIPRAVALLVWHPAAAPVARDGGRP